MAETRIVNNCQGEWIGGSQEDLQIEAQLTSVVDEAGQVSVYGLYSFLCTTCGLRETKPANKFTIDMLVFNGAPVERTLFDMRIDPDLIEQIINE